MSSEDRVPDWVYEEPDIVLLEFSLSEASSELYGKPEEFDLEFDLPVRLDKALDLVSGVRDEPEEKYESESCESPR